MTLRKRVVSVLGVLLGMWVLTGLVSYVDHVLSAELSQTVVRPSRLQAGASPLPILIQFQTTQLVVEDGVRVTVAPAWTISSVASDFTISTANLPAGVTAVPGIGTASSVVGSAITFPASNLNSGTTYGFYLTGGITSNPAAGSGLNYVWDVATLVGGVVDSNQLVGVSINKGDQIVFNATVWPTANDFSATLTSNSQTNLSPGSIVTYTITYGSNYTQSSPITFEAQWSLGTLQGGTTPTLPILSYIDGSASEAFGSTVPIIDTINQKITWSIVSLPANTQNQTVTFQLLVTQLSTNGVQAIVPVSTRVVAPVTTPDSTITHTYGVSTPSVSPTPTVVITPTPTPTATTSVPGAPTSTPLPGGKKACNTSCVNDAECSSNYCWPSEKLCRSKTNPTDRLCRSISTETQTSPQPATQFSVAVTQVGPTSASIAVSTSQAGSIILSYSDQPGNLTNKTESSSLTKFHLINLSSLLPATTYYFQLANFDQDGKSYLSDIYQFTTASSPASFSATQFQVAVSSSGMLLANQFDNRLYPPVVLPVLSPYELTVQTPMDSSIKRVSVRILAADEFGQKIQDSFSARASFELLKSHQSTFVGSGMTTSHVGKQYLEFQVEDYAGNIQTFREVILLISPFLTVRSLETNKPIEHVKLLLSRYDPESQLFQTLPAPYFLTANPIYSQSDGSYSLVLPPGKYRGVFKVYGYDTKEVDFEIGGESEAVYPVVKLSSAGWSVLDLIGYYADAIWTKITGFSHPVSEVTTSQLLFNLLAFLSLSCLVVVSFISLAARLGVSIWQLPRIVWLKLHAVRRPDQYWQVKSRLVGETAQPITSAVIAVVGVQQQVLMQCLPNQEGAFQISLNQPTARLLITAQGYVPYEQEMKDSKENGGVAEMINLETSEPTQKKLWHDFKGISKLSLQGLFEMILLLSFIMEILFIPYFGFWAVLPFLLLSSLNGLMWVVYVYHERAAVVEL